MLNVVIASKNRDEALLCSLVALGANYSYHCFVSIYFGDASFLSESWKREIIFWLESQGMYFRFIDNVKGNLGTAITSALSDEVLKGKIILKMDDDMLCEKGSVEKMLEMISNETVGLVSVARPTSEFKEQEIETLNEAESFNEGNIWRQDYPWDKSIVVNSDKAGGIYMLKNIFDFGVIPDFGEDRKVSAIIKENGMQIKIATKPYFWHFGIGNSHYEDVYKTLPPKQKL